MRIAITGCCVSRDIFNYDSQGLFDVRKFVQLNPISCLKKGGIKILRDFEELQFQSDFIRNCAKCALLSDLVNQLIGSKAEKLIIDLADERIPKAQLIDAKGNITLVANHFFYKPMWEMFGRGGYAEVGVRSIGFDAIPWNDVEKAYKYFVKKIVGGPGGFEPKDIVIVEAYMTKEFVNSEYRLVEFNKDNSPFSQEYISVANEYLKRCYDLLRSLLPESTVIKIPDNVYSVYYHRWDNNPLHYVPETYKYLLECVNIAFGKSNSETLDSLYADFKFRNHLTRKILAEREE